MNLATFLSTIHGTGRLSVGRDFVVSCDGLEQALRDLDQAVRHDGPAGLPELDVLSASWAIERVHAASVLLAHRDLDAHEMERHLDAVVCPGDPHLPSTHYSVDLTMRHLPELWRLARGLAPADPLLAALQRLAVAWPLSSVGMPDVGGSDPAPLLHSSGLRRVYVDRILRHKDAGRAAHPRVASAIEAAVGAHRAMTRSVLAGVDRPIRETES